MTVWLWLLVAACYLLIAAFSAGILYEWESRSSTPDLFSVSMTGMMWPLIWALLFVFAPLVWMYRKGHKTGKRFS